MSEVKTKIYRYPNPGFRLTLFDEEGNPVKNQKNGKSTALFKDTGHGADRCGLCYASDEGVQKAIEISKPFKSGLITKILSPEDIAIESKRAEKAKFLENTKEMVKNGLITEEDVKKMDGNKLYSLANKIGATVSDKDGKRLLKDKLLGEVEVVLFSEEEK